MMRKFQILTLLTLLTLPLSSFAQRLKPAADAEGNILYASCPNMDPRVAAVVAERNAVEAAINEEQFEYELIKVDTRSNIEVWWDASGVPRKVVVTSGIDQYVRGAVWSYHYTDPDGQQMLYIRGDEQQGMAYLPFCEGPTRAYYLEGKYVMTITGDARIYNTANGGLENSDPYHREAFEDVMKAIDLR